MAHQLYDIKVQNALLNEKLVDTNLDRIKLSSDGRSSIANFDTRHSYKDALD